MLETMHDSPDEEHHHDKKYQADCKLKKRALSFAINDGKDGRAAFRTSQRMVADRCAAFVKLDESHAGVDMLLNEILHGISLDAGSRD